MNNGGQIYRLTFRTIIIRATFVLFIGLLAFLPIQNIFAQSADASRRNSVAPSKNQLKIELADLKAIVLKKIDDDLESTALGFTNSAAIRRDLRTAYSFKTALDIVGTAFGTAVSVGDVRNAKTLLEGGMSSSTTVAALLLAYSNAEENGGKLALFFPRDRYVDSVNRMLDAAKQGQPSIGFNPSPYHGKVKSWLDGDEGQNIIYVNHARLRGLCTTPRGAINPRGASPEKRPPLRGANEVRRYVSDLFVNLETKINAKNFSEAQAARLIQIVKQIKRSFIESRLRRAAVSLSIPRENAVAGCFPVISEFELGQIAGNQIVLQKAYEALDKNLRVEQAMTVKAVGDAVFTAVGLNASGQTAENLQRYGQFSLGFDIGKWTLDKVFSSEPEKLIADIPQEMLLSLSAEFSNVVLLLDTLAAIVRETAENTKPENPPVTTLPINTTLSEVPTLFLFDASGSMLDNDKIGQARNSSLIALREIQENKRLGRVDTPISVWTFNGECSPNTARQILPFTTNLSQAENVLSSKIPRPDGGTPLPQAILKATAQMNDYLNSRSQVNEGRIILLSDGQSTCGAIRPAGIYSQAQTITVKKIRFLTIGFGIEPGSAAERDLQYLASASGGQYFPAQNQQQLSRAFEKTIRVYLPKAISNASPEFENVTNAILRRDFQRAAQFAADYLKNNSADAFGYYNLAVSLEALSRYKGAAENYRKYLQLATAAADRREIEGRIAKLEQDYLDQFFYYQRLLQSDLDYLKAYYQRLFNREIEKNAAEFAGFVSEKQPFYANLPEILEIRSIRIERDAQDLSDSLGILNRRVGLKSFDRDAVSLLTIPIGQLEDVIERIENYRVQNLK